MTGNPNTSDSVEKPADWKQVPPDPDLESDLGYQIAEMDVIETSNGSGQILFLPWDEDMLRDDSFIVAQGEDIANLIDWR